MKPYDCEVSGSRITLFKENEEYYWRLKNHESTPHKTLAEAMQNAVGYITRMKREKK